MGKERICLSCESWRKEFINTCRTCLLLSKVKCNKCNIYDYSKYCTRPLKQIYYIINNNLFIYVSECGTPPRCFLRHNICEDISNSITFLVYTTVTISIQLHIYLNFLTHKSIIFNNISIHVIMPV